MFVFVSDSFQIFFSFGPFGVSSMTQPFAFNSSRMASDFLKSFALRAAFVLQKSFEFGSDVITSAASER